MTKLIATFRIVTPMFLGGANPSEQAELRVPSIKGALRFWWRALMWGKVAGIADLRSREADLFGSSDSNVGQSKVLLSIKTTTPPVLLKREEILGKHGLKSSQQNDVVGEGARYLGYGLMEAFDGKASVGGRLMRPCLAAPCEFHLHLRVKACASDAQKCEIQQALKLLGLCGGLGSRSRRGFGSASLVSLKNYDELLWSAPLDLAGWEKELRMALGTLNRSEGQPEWTSFAAGHSKVVTVSGNSESPLELLASLGRDFVFFRSWGRGGKVLGRDSEKKFKDDHDLMKNAAKARQTHPRRIAFGLPHNYGKPVDQQVEPADGDYDRRASSMLFHIHQPSANNLPLGVLLFLPSRFLPQSRDRISVGGQNVRLAHDGNGDFWKPVHDFMERLISGSDKEKFNDTRLIQL